MIPKNAITMRGRIERCWLLALRVPAAEVAEYLPAPLEPLTKQGFAFFNVVVSQLSHMRPAALPAWTGIGYWHAAYRIYAKWRDIEGLYFLRSDADSPLMVAAGNLLTDFRFHLARIGTDEHQVFCHAEGADLSIRLLQEPPRLASGSPFASLAEAERFLKYKPAGLSVAADHVDVLRITRNEEEWQAKLRAFRVEELGYLAPFGATPELLYEMKPIQYQWNRARRIPVNS